jgi:hypothetical protein
MTRCPAALGAGDRAASLLIETRVATFHQGDQVLLLQYHSFSMHHVSRPRRARAGVP